MTRIERLGPGDDGKVVSAGPLFDGEADKGTEMFLYELAVAEPFQRRGIGKALVVALAEIARAAGCYGMFVLTSPTNAAALATYQGAGAEPEGEHAMLGWDFTAGRP